MLWLWFVRGTMGAAWLVGTWTIITLLSVDKNQALISQTIQSVVSRIDKIEARLDEKDKEEIQWLREKIPREP